MSYRAQRSDGATLDLAHVGHVLLDDHGTILGTDAGFAAMLRMTTGSLIGRSVLEITAPDHRRACTVGMSNLRATGQPFVVRKQMLRGDDTIVWVERTTAVSCLADGRTMILATFVPIVAPEPRLDPAVLLDQARFLSDGRSDLRETFGGALFGNPAWDLLLHAYIVEAEGHAIDIARIATAAHIAPAVAIRWARALAADGLLEIETGGGKPYPRYRLSNTALEKIEHYLSRRLRKLTALSIFAPRQSGMTSC